jgi:hypothetical protein
MLHASDADTDSYADPYEDTDDHQDVYGYADKASCNSDTDEYSLPPGAGEGEGASGRWRRRGPDKIQNQGLGRQ